MHRTKTSKQSLQTCVTYGEEEPNHKAWKIAKKRKHILWKFLNKELSADVLKKYKIEVELIKKCSYYIEFLPRNLAFGEQYYPMLQTTMFQYIDPHNFERMKKVGASQAKIELILLDNYLEELQKGRETLVGMVQSFDTMSFLSKWEVAGQHLSQLNDLMYKLSSMLVPNQLHIKHRFVPEILANKIPFIRLMLIAKSPVLFDRKESVAYKDKVQLKWYSHKQQHQHQQQEKYEVFFKSHDATQEGTFSVTTNSIEICSLVQNSLYDFSVRYAVSYTLVYEAWHDTITLHTKATNGEAQLSGFSNQHVQPPTHQTK
ncbi:fibronectin type III domain-containing protein 11 [Bombina bombina]|uniref:fibronectin type III domain-containing protein 11 n=1 Tax=Bombina bombina TaxID=8345 RepID=UPI00235A605E|nr:fibronectin type III domain-containing protein 11 [Bombina bombina]